MTIERKYETYEALATRDPKANELIRKHLSHFSEEEKDRIINESLYDVIICHSDIGSGIDNFQLLLRELEELDKTNPYDNGLKFTDITETISMPSRKGDACTYISVSKRAELPTRIVCIFAFEHSNNILHQIKNFDISGVYF